MGRRRVFQSAQMDNGGSRKMKSAIIIHHHHGKGVSAKVPQKALGSKVFFIADDLLESELKRIVPDYDVVYVIDGETETVLEFVNTKTEVTH
jgi:hypothetical protein